MTNLIINLLGGLVLALLIALIIIVAIYKDKVKKAYKRCAEVEHQNKELRNKILSLCNDLNEVCDNREKQKTKIQIAEAIINNQKNKRGVKDV